MHVLTGLIHHGGWPLTVFAAPRACEEGFLVKATFWVYWLLDGVKRVLLGFRALIRAARGLLRGRRSWCVNQPLEPEGQSEGGRAAVLWSIGKTPSTGTRRLCQRKALGLPGSLQ